MSTVPKGRVAGWFALVAVLAGIAYAGRATAGPPSRDILYRYSTAVGAIVEFAILAVVLLALTRGLDRREVIALKRPQTWGGGLGYAALAFAAIWLAGLALSPFLDAGKDQGLVPDRWEAAHAGAFAANFIVVVVAAPLVEETVFRGFGMSAIGGSLGPVAAVVLTALGWGLGHGLVAGLPILFVFGVILGVLRLRTGSVLPGMVTHAAFNAVSLVLAVTVGTKS